MGDSLYLQIAAVLPQSISGLSNRNDLQRIADAIVRRILAENPDDLREALVRAYPFGDHPEASEVWAESLKRHGVFLPGERNRGGRGDGP